MTPSTVPQAVTGAIHGERWGAWARGRLKVRWLRAVVRGVTTFSLSDLTPADLAPVGSGGRTAGSTASGDVTLGGVSGRGVVTRRGPRAADGAIPRLTTDLEQRGFALHRRIARDDLPRIDHVVVAASGVWLVAREHVHCARVSVRRRHLTGDQVLRIGTRDRTALIDTLDEQVTAVRALLFDHLDAPVQAALLLPGAEFPLLRTLTARDHLILRPAQLLTHLDARGPLKRSAAREVAAALDARLG